jgi:hypothetical protein
MTGILTAAELTAMQDAISLLLPDTCNILTVTSTPDGMGGVTKTIGTALSGVACRLDDASAPMQLTGGAVQIYSGFMLSIPYNTSISETNLVEIGSTRYTVKSINDGQSWNAVKRVEVEAL